MSNNGAVRKESALTASCRSLVMGAIIGRTEQIIEFERELVHAEVRVVFCVFGVGKNTPVFNGSIRADAAERLSCVGGKRK